MGEPEIRVDLRPAHPSVLDAYRYHGGRFTTPDELTQTQP